MPSGNPYPDFSLDVVIENNFHFTDRDVRRHAAGDPSTTGSGAGQSRSHFVRRFLPPTIVDNTTRPLIARRLMAIQDYFDQNTSYPAPMGETLFAAAEYCSFFNIPLTAYNQAFFIAPRMEDDALTPTGMPPPPPPEPYNQTGISNVRNIVTASGAYDQVNTLAVKTQPGGPSANLYIDRAEAIKLVGQSTGALLYPAGWSTLHTNFTLFEDDSSMTAEADAFTFIDPGTMQFAYDARYVELVQLMLARMAHCPGDYDCDGDVDPQDLLAFRDDSLLRASNAPISHPVSQLYPDWNFDYTSGTFGAKFDGHVSPPSLPTQSFEQFGPDYTKFYVLHSFGGCP